MLAVASRGFVPFKLRWFLLASLLVVAMPLVHPSTASAAAGACATPTTDYGTVTGLTVTTTSTTSDIWSRIAIPDSSVDSNFASDNNFCLEIDNTSDQAITHYSVTGAAGARYTSTDATNSTYFNNDSSNWVDTNVSGDNLSAGTYHLKLVGEVPNVLIDRVLLTQAGSCTGGGAPTGTGDNCANPPDTTPPSLSITSPMNGASNLTNPVSVSVNATDDSGVVSSVTVYVDGSSTGTSTSSSTNDVFTVQLPTLSPGSHTITASATDPTGNEATTGSSTSFTVKDTTAPTNVSVTNPTNGATMSGTISLGANAQDNVGVSKFAFVVDSGTPINVAVSPAASPATASTSFDTAALSNGTHTVQVTAYDAQNNTTTSSSVSFTVNNTGGSGTPSVALTAPTANTIIAGTSTNAFVLSATATEAGGSIKNVVFKIDGVTKATVTSAPYTYNLDTSSLATGAHTITAQATDTSNVVSNIASAMVRVTLMADVNRSCAVNFTDISAILPKLGTGTVGATNTGPADVNGSGNVNFTDISAILPKLGNTPC